jgi:hypothetical protein
MSKESINDGYCSKEPMFTIIYPKNNHGLGCKIEKALSDLRQQEQRCGRLFKTNVKQYTKKNETKKKQNIIK